jgi:hypothetical protein
VTLAADGGATILKYAVDADVGGKLAQLGGRLIEGTSKKLAGEFFEAFKVALAAPAAAHAEVPTPAPAPAPSRAAGGMPTWVWAGLAAFIAGFIVFLLAFQR